MFEETVQRRDPYFKVRKKKTKIYVPERSSKEIGHRFQGRTEDFEPKFRREKSCWKKEKGGSGVSCQVRHEEHEWRIARRDKCGIHFTRPKSINPTVRSCMYVSSACMCSRARLRACARVCVCVRASRHYRAYCSSFLTWCRLTPLRSGAMDSPVVFVSLRRDGDRDLWFPRGKSRPNRCSRVAE